MKSSFHRQFSCRGSSLITVVLFIAMMALLTASMLTYTLSERRGNERNRLILRANTMAENITDYAADQLTTKLFRLGSAPVGVFPWTGTSKNRVILPPASVLTNPPYTDVSTAEMRTAIMSATPYTLVTDTTDPNCGLQVATALVPIIAKVTASHPALGNYTSYVEQDMALTLTPLFQFGMFYNMDLELYPSQAFTLAGPVHTNNRLMVHPDGSQTIAVTFTDRVTVADSLFADSGIKVVPRGGSGTPNPMVAADGDVIFTDLNAPHLRTSLKDVDWLWRDQKYKTATQTGTTDSNFASFANATFNGNLKTKVMGVTKLELPGIGTYLEQNDTGTAGDDRSNGRQIIEPPNAKVWTWDNLLHTGSWTANTDAADLKQTKLSWKAGLYIIANPDDNIRSCIVPDGTTQYLLPYSYRAFLNTVTNTGNTVAEIILPGQPSYGYNNGPDGIAGNGDDYMYNNYLPNRYATDNNVGGNQVLRIPQQGFGVASGYAISHAGGYAAGTTGTPVTTLQLSGGSGPIQIGDTITISSPAGTASFKYLVTGADPVAGTITIGAPGLRAAVANGDPVTVDFPSSTVGSGTGYHTSATRAIGATSIAVSGGSGTIPIGNIITIGANKYQVVTALTPVVAGNVVIAAPGLVAAVANNIPVTVDACSGTIGSGAAYTTSGSTSLNATDISVAIGTGTILPGNTITIGSFKYLVTSALTSGTVRIAQPGVRGGSAVASGTSIVVDATSGTLGTAVNYSTSAAAVLHANSVTVASGTGTVLPGNTLAIGSYKYLVASTASPVPATTTTITLVGDNAANAGLLEAVANGSLVIADSFPYSGYSRAGGGGAVYPADSAAVNLLSPAAAYFFDMRRATSNRGVITLPSTTALYDRFTIPYVPRPLAKIDFDVARFHMMVDRVISAAVTSVGYDLRPPTMSEVTWSHSIFNSDPATTTESHGLGRGTAFPYNILPNPGTGAVNAPDPFQVYYAPADPSDPATILAIATDPRGRAVPTTDWTGAWYDGLAVYIHSVDAEIRKQTVAGTPDRLDSGVRLWNGRGVAPTLNITGKTGFTFITNDAVYIIGHYNADGKINSDDTATGTGGYSARYPDVTAEKLCAVMGDAITTLSQPVWDSATSGQTYGWNDALSALPSTASTAGWRTGSSATDTLVGGTDGVYVTTGPKPGLLPNDHNQATALGTATTVKLGALDTEMSTCLLVGIVPSNASPGYVPGATAGVDNFPAVTDGYVPTWTHAATGDPLVIGNRVNAGGANNFPRLLENWQPGGNRKGLYIRGSMVALFESRVAMEPFTNSRSYSAPGRFWGLHESLRNANHDVPLEPLVLGSSRVGFKQLTPALYNTRKTDFEAMTHLP